MKLEIDKKKKKVPPPSATSVVKADIKPMKLGKNEFIVAYGLQTSSQVHQQVLLTPCTITHNTTRHKRLLTRDEGV